MNNGIRFVAAVSALAFIGYLGLNIPANTDVMNAQDKEKGRITYIEQIIRDTANTPPLFSVVNLMSATIDTPFDFLKITKDDECLRALVRDMIRDRVPRNRFTYDREVVLVVRYNSATGSNGYQVIENFTAWEKLIDVPWKDDDAVLVVATIPPLPKRQ